MTSGQITANLPSRDFDTTESFYRRLGFDTEYRGNNWMILNRDGMWVEFFPHPDLKLEDSWFSACLRLPRIDALHTEWRALDLPALLDGSPRLGDPMEMGGDVPRMFTLFDLDGSLWRVLEMGGDA